METYLSITDEDVIQEARNQLVPEDVISDPRFIKEAKRLLTSSDAQEWRNGFIQAAIIRGQGACRAEAHTPVTITPDEATNDGVSQPKASKA
jgi:hypothetical protein